MILKQWIMNNWIGIKHMKTSFYGALILFGAYTVFSLIRFALYQHKLYRYLLENHTATLSGQYKVTN